MFEIELYIYSFIITNGQKQPVEVIARFLFKI